MSVAALTRRGGDDAHLPKSVPGLQLWLDASTPGSAFADSDPVPTWTDLSGLGNNVTQAVSGHRPLWRSTAVTTPNGKPVIQFDGTDDSLTAALALPGSSSIYIVAAKYGTVTTETVLLFFRDSLYPMANTLDLSSGKVRCTVRDDAGTASTQNSSAASVVDGVMFVASGVRTHSTTDSITVSLNGTVSGASTPCTLGTLTQTQAYIGIRYDGTRPLAGTVACVLAYSGVHSAGTRKQIERWLGRRYGVTVAQ